MGQTMATYSGQNYGAGRIDRIHLGVRTAAAFSATLSVVEGLIVWFLTPYTLGLFFSSQANVQKLLPWATPYIGSCVLCYIPLSLLFIYRNTMQGCGYGLLPMLGGVMELAARLTASLLAIHTGVYLFAAVSDPSAWVAAGVFTGLAYLYVMKDIHKKQAALQRASA